MIFFIVSKMEPFEFFVIASHLLRVTYLDTLNKYFLL